MNKDFIYRRRLLSLVDLLRKLPRRRFRYNSWVGGDWKGKADLSCGTTACALGWATTIPALRKVGLRLKRNSFGDIYISLNDSKDNMCDFGFDSDSAAKASRLVFGLSYEEFCFLFIPGSLLDYKIGPSSKASAKTVANHIEKFVNNRFPEK